MNNFRDRISDRVLTVDATGFLTVGDEDIAATIRLSEGYLQAHAQRTLSTTDDRSRLNSVTGL